MIVHVVKGCQCQGKRCPKCEETKCTGAFHKRADKSSSELRAHCKKCMYAYTQEWCKVHPREAKTDDMKQRPQITLFSHANDSCQCAGKRCEACEKLKCIGNFFRDKQNTDGHTSQCKICRGKVVKEWKEANKDKVNAGAAWRHNQKGRRHYLKANYGLTEVQHAEMVARQKGVCAICGVANRRTLHVDHDHATGQIRALLCTQCNSMLGYARDSVELLKKAIEYLELYAQGG